MSLSFVEHNAYWAEKVNSDPSLSWTATDDVVEAYRDMTADEFFKTVTVFKKKDHKKKHNKKHHKKHHKKINKIISEIENLNMSMVETMDSSSKCVDKYTWCPSYK